MDDNISLLPQDRLTLALLPLGQTTIYFLYPWDRYFCLTPLGQTMTFWLSPLGQTMISCHTPMA